MGSKTFALQTGSIMPRVTTGNTMAPLPSSIGGAVPRKALRNEHGVRDILGGRAARRYELPLPGLLSSSIVE